MQRMAAKQSRTSKQNGSPRPSVVNFLKVVTELRIYKLKNARSSQKINEIIIKSVKYAFCTMYQICIKQTAHICRINCR